ncbi:MAG: alkane 1-monooxygenase [Paracoccaceae bacterium]|nr:MAG: alkane 1-monooxygenase [Paracoccaceae bacterium]
MALFAAAALLPLGLMAMGAMAGGAWAVAGLAWITLFAAAMDRFVPWVLPDAPEGSEFPAADPLLVAIGLLHLLALPLAVHAVAGASGLAGWERATLFAAFGLWFGQVANPAAHELIHRGDRRLFRLGAAVYASLGFGHHASAHRLVHHRHAASRADPNTARPGEGYYRFFLRAWAGSFREGRRAEAARPRGLHPYAWYLAGTAAAAGLAVLLAGGWGLAAWAGLALHAQSQLLLSDYVQHYGLQRRAGPDGRLEPVGDRHSWNAPHWFTGAMMLNAPRHSDHHAHPARPFPALRLPGPDDAPRLPHALPVCCVVALVPPVWRRMMAPHVARWRG